jgi:uncharacterized protein
MHLTLHITTACNMRCSYCYSPPKPGPVMSEETGGKAMEMAAKMNKDSTGVIFFGGEPLLHKDLIRTLVDRARDMEAKQTGRFHFKITTNGVLLDEEFLKYSLENDILIAMSFDGVQPAHDQHRLMADGAPSFESLIDKLQLLLAARPYSSVLMVVNPDTAQYLYESVEFLLGLGCRYLIVSLNYAGNWDESSFRVLEKQYKKLGKLYIKWTLANQKFYLSPFEVKLSSHINRHCYQKERCELAQRQISVDPRGFLYPCVQFTKAGPQSSWCIGSLETGIDEKARARLFKESQAEKEQCLGCAISKRCNNTCGCLNWQTTGSINTISSVLCKNEQVLMPIADRVGNYLFKKRNPLFLHKHYNAAYPVLSLLEDNLSK